MRFAFVTCVKIGFKCIQEIYDSGYCLELIITLDDKNGENKSGRVYLDDFCKQKSIELLKVNNINDNFCVEKIKSKKIDWLFIIGWSQIAKSKILNATAYGAIGAHPTLLPQGRGRASIPWAILKSLKYTGVSFFKLDEGVDTGQLIEQYKIKIDESEDANSLYEKVIKAHVKLISKILPNLNTLDIRFKDQDESKSSYWPGRKPEDGLINLNGSVNDAQRLIRATTRPYPGAYYFKNAEKIIIWKAKKINDLNHQSKNKNFLKFNDGVLYIEEMTIEKY